MKAPPDNPKPGQATCPRCRQPGRAVSASTVAALLKPEASRRLATADGYYFCATRDCDAAYFKSGADDVILQREVRVPIFQKSSDPARPVCYCFGYTVEAVQSEVRAKGVSSILEDIKARCAQGLSTCERSNPQGSCCLGNVQRLIREVATGTGPSASGGCCCCGND